jgi:glycosyltransferase involved in cell wall biosynthesis
MELKKTYLLSIIIPTRNREDYAFASVMQVLGATNDDVQIVLQDNSDTNSLLDRFINSSDLHRIKYNYSPGTLSFIHNFCKGVEEADGEYLCMIGDDDGINPEIVDFVHWAKSKNIEAISPEIRLNYIWPNTGISYYKNDYGNLMIIDFSMHAKLYETKKELIKLLKSGGQNYLKYNLAKIYHGIVTKKAMNEVKEITGNYFGGLSPDIYSSLTLSLVVDKVLKIDYPLTIPGVCRNSGSGQAATGRHVGKLQDAPQLIGHYNYKWSNLVPKFYSVETIWADSALAALKDMNREDLMGIFNVSRLSAYCYFNYSEYRKIIIENYTMFFKKKGVSNANLKIKLIIEIINGPYKDFFYKVVNKLTRKTNSVNNYEDVINIIEAEKIFSNYLKQRSLSVNKMIEKLKYLQI